MTTTLHPRAAATLVLVRDTPDGLQVLMLQRTHQAAFVPGFHVFPGGAVDQDDQDFPDTLLVSTTHTSKKSPLPNSKNDNRAYLIAAIRETFEEAGLLLALDDQDHGVTGQHPVFQGRQALHDGQRPFSDLCDSHKLRLPLYKLGYLDRWITPKGPPRRFDTRFFLAAVPPEQTAIHDGQEIIDSCWITPKQALDAFYQRKIWLVPPTYKTLEKLQSANTVSQAFDKLTQPLATTSSPT